MSRALTFPLPFLVGALVVALLPTSVRSQATETEQVFVRAQQMVTGGQGDAGRAVIDSVLAATDPGSPRYAEALFWRASLARTAADAEKDYLRVSIEYPLSPRAQESLLRLAQLEIARNDRTAARAHLERLQREHPLGPTSTRASVMLARLAFEDGDLPQACEALTAARAGVPKEDIELRNQLDYYAPRCVGVVARSAADSAARSAGGAPGGAAAQDSAARTSEARREAPAGRTASRSGAEYSVQVAAYNTRGSATALVKRLSQLGFSARVVGSQRPYRVRVGRYATRQLAEDALRRMRAANVDGVVVQAEARQ